MRQVQAANKLYNRLVLIKRVENDDGSYRPMDDRTLDHLRWADTWKRGQAAVKEIEKRNEALEISRQKSFDDDVEAISRDVHKHVAKGFDQVVGTRNIPKEDSRKAVDDFVEGRSEENRMKTKRL